MQMVPTIILAVEGYEIYLQLQLNNVDGFMILVVIDLSKIIFFLVSFLL
jgi:hypothetical protein